MGRLSNEKAILIKRLVNLELGYFLEHDRYVSEDGQVDITKIATDLGFDVYSLDLSKEKVKGLMYVNKKRGRESRFIAVHDEHSIQSKRFIIAHELGHYFLEKGKNESEYISAAKYTDNQSAEDENELAADYFAGYSLIPDHKFNELMESLKKQCNGGDVNIERKIEAVSNTFNVSSRVARLYIEVREGTAA